ncbi:MAG: ATP-binding cassette domain-containing protein [Sphingomonadales bacterium]|nr:ATP-binding cassette domain-containing protein [Sphingomonadales bacterium]MBM3923355.1 ATP-binding cassette domain-containing protein [Sphingomonadales bacterium]
MARPRFNSNHQTEAPVRMSRIRSEQIRQAHWLWPFLGPYRRDIFLGAILLVLGTGLSLSIPWLMGQMIDKAMGGEGSGKALGQIAMVLGTILAIQAGISFVRIRLVITMAEKVLADVRDHTFRHLVQMPMVFYMRHRVGELQSRLSADLSQIQDTVSSTLMEWLRQILVLIGGVLMLLWISWKLTFFLLAILPILILIAVVFGRKIRRLAGNAQDELAKAQVVVEETLQNISMVKVYTGESLQGDQYRRGLSATVDQVIKAAQYRGAFAAFIVFGLFGSVVLVLWYGASLVQTGGMSVGELSGFVLYSTFVGGAMGSFAELYGQVQKALGATERVHDLLQEPSEGVWWEGKTPFQWPQGGASLQLQDLSFAYPTRPEVKVLSNVNLSLKAGERLAVIGPSGAGKSTLVSLLMGFYAPEQGSIRIHGVDLRSLCLSDYRKGIAVVPQDLMLFGGSIAENIAYGSPHTTLVQIREAASQAHALDFIESFPAGFDTMVGERGIQLSGGQRQRVAIARAILRNPSLLLLDEATSALDTDSEKAVQLGLDSLMKGRTTVVVAHRLSTVRDADQIMFLDRGVVQEFGSPAQLMAVNGGRYRTWLEDQGRVHGTGYLQLQDHEIV